MFIVCKFRDTFEKEACDILVESNVLVAHSLDYSRVQGSCYLSEAEQLSSCRKLASFPEGTMTSHG